jgi:hypothetical protein
MCHLSLNLTSFLPSWADSLGGLVLLLVRGATSRRFGPASVAHTVSASRRDSALKITGYLIILATPSTPTTPPPKPPSQPI